MEEFAVQREGAKELFQIVKQICFYIFYNHLKPVKELRQDQAS